MKMDFIPLIPFLGVSVPESLIIYYMVLTILGRKESRVFIILLSFLTSLFSYLLRSIPMVFGIHSILQILLMIIFLTFLLKLPWRASIASVILTSVILGLVEGIFVPFLSWIFVIDIGCVISDPWLRMLFTLPHLLFLGAVTYIANKRKWRLPFIIRLMEVDDEAGAKTENQSHSQTRLLVLCTVQALVVVLLRINFYIYTSDVYPSLTLDTLVQISILVLMVGALATIAVVSYLISVTEREARLIVELRHVRERHNINLRLQVERHDFYNHLTAVYGYLKSGNYMLAETYIKNLYKTVVDIKSLLKLNPPELAALLSVKQEEARNKKIDFDWKVNIERSNLPLSAEDFTHLVGNLLNNAFEAAKTSHTPMVELVVATNAMGLSLKVANNGKPIPLEVRDTIFTAGYTTKDANQHSGLGLYIINQIVNRHNGHLELKDPENYKGTEFVIHMPWSS